MDELYELQRVMRIKDSQEQVRELLRLADKGYAGAQTMIGRFYHEGSGGLKKDDKKALEYFKKAADQGEEYSQWMVWSVTSEIDTATPYNENSYAFRNLVKAADAGYTSAIAFVTYAYAFGNMDVAGGKNWVIEKSKSKAEQYLNKLYDKIGEDGDSGLAQIASVVKGELDKEADAVYSNEYTDISYNNINNSKIKSTIALIFGVVSLLGVHWLAIPGVIISKVAKDNEETKVALVAIIVNIIALVFLLYVWLTL